MEKKCFKCGEVKILSEFYKHKMMADGHLNKCKTCTKVDVANHRADNIERIREYDRARGSRQSSEYFKEYKTRFPKKIKAQALVAKNVKLGHIKKEPCEICNKERAVAHHDDYDHPLKVRWLCQAHHKQWHAENGDGANPL